MNTVQCKFSMRENIDVDIKLTKLWPCSAIVIMEIFGKDKSPNNLVNISLINNSYVPYDTRIFL